MDECLLGLGISESPVHCDRRADSGEEARVQVDPDGICVGCVRFTKLTSCQYPKLGNTAREHSDAHGRRVCSLMSNDDRCLGRRVPDIPCRNQRVNISTEEEEVGVLQYWTEVPSPPDATGLKSELAWQFAPQFQATVFEGLQYAALAK